MRIALTGATGFIGRYIVRQLAAAGHTIHAWTRPASDRSGLDDVAGRIEWLVGELNDPRATRALVNGCDAVVHAALWRPGAGFRGAEGDIVEFTERNVIGSLRLIEVARQANVGRFVFVSTCAVHERILDDRPLDETHPTWALSHYGAHKAAIEQFVYSYGLGQGYPICALRPSGVYGVAHPPPESKWYSLIRSVVRGESVTCERGGKEVISEWAVAQLAKQLAGSSVEIGGRATTAKNTIVTDKLQALGMTFGGRGLLEATLRELVLAAQE